MRTIESHHLKTVNRSGTLNIVQLIGKISEQNLAALHQWCEEQRHQLKPTVSRYAPGREELWIKRHCDLRRKPTISNGYRDERIEQLGNRLLPGFDIALLLYYKNGVCINAHRDHSVFEPTAVCVNLGYASFYQQCSKDLTKCYFLGNGHCLKFDSKKLHWIDPITTNERWSIIFWHLKPQYLK